MVNSEKKNITLKNSKVKTKTKSSSKRSNKYSNKKSNRTKWFQKNCKPSMYYSNDGMQPNVFGPVVWHFLHLMSFNYPVKPSVQDQNNYIDFLFSLSNVLPCKSCREHMKQNLLDMGFRRNSKTIRKIMSSRSTFSKFLFHFHNKVNCQLRKPVHKNYSKVRKQYEMYRSRKRNPQEKHFHISVKAKVLCEPKSL